MFHYKPEERALAFPQGLTLNELTKNRPGLLITFSGEIG